MAQEIAYCINDHQINGVVPVVDETKFEIQHPEFIGVACDCHRLLYYEGQCQTCNGAKWRVTWKENPNA